MRKALLVLTIILLVAMLSVVSCKSDPVEPEEDGAIHASTFAEFTKGLTSAKKTESKTLILDADIVWDSTKYPGGADVTGDEEYRLNSGKTVSIRVARLNEGALTIDVTGLTIDLGGHTISNIPSRAFNLTGNSFTIKNGTLSAAAGSDRYTLCINYANTNIKTESDKSVTDGLKDVALDHVPASYTDSDAVWAKRIVVDGIKTQGIIAAYSTVEIKNSSSTNEQYRGFNLIGSSGIVENCSSSSTVSENAALFVSNYGSVLIKGTNMFAGRIGLYVYHCATVTVDTNATFVVGDHGATIGDKNNYAYAVERQSELVIKGTIKFNTIAPKAIATFNNGSRLVIAAGATVLDKTDAIVNKGGDGVSTKADSKGSYDSAWAGYNVAPVVTDNRE